jgi:BMFP domain-containing protein YqiC
MKANEGPPTDPKVFEEQQKKLQEDLQKRADELRKKLENQGGTPPK